MLRGSLFHPPGSRKLQVLVCAQYHVVCTVASIAAEWGYYITVTCNETPVSRLNYSRQLKLSSDTGVFSAATCVAVTERPAGSVS